MAESYTFIRKYGVFHLVNDITTSRTADYDKAMFSDILFTDVIVDLGKNQFK